jgi:cysteine desulfurase/selenocysteine lyase
MIARSNRQARLADSEEFPGLREGVYVNTAAEGLFMRSHDAALQRYSEAKRRGSLGRDEHARAERQTREACARLVACQAEDIAFLASTARGLDAAIKSIDWRPDDNIVLPDSEFPTAAFAAARLSQFGVQTRVVPSVNGRVELDDVKKRVDERTRLIVVSLVSYKTGHKIDLQAWARIAHAAGALLFVDAVQALGAIPIDATQADFLCGATYKWLLGQHGVALLYVNPALSQRIDPPYVGYRGVKDLFPPNRFERYDLWGDARRFEEGMPNYPALYVLNNALGRLVSIGVDRIAAHNAALADKLISGLLSQGVEPLTSLDPAARASIVSIETAQPEQIVAELARRRVHVWGRDGRIRISFHLYNDDSDVDAILGILPALLRPLSEIAADPQTTGGEGNGG